MQEGLDSTTTTNRLAMLRLGSTTTTTDSDGAVIFSDPCSCCGAMKRLRSSSSSPLQESHPRNKKILIESPSSSSINNTLSVSPPLPNIHHSDHLQPNPFLRLTPNSSFPTPVSPSLQSLPFIRTSSNSVPFTSSENNEINNNNVNSLSSNSPPVSCFNLKSSLPFIRRCNSVPLTTSENSSEINNNVNSLPSTSPPVSFSNPKSPENFGSTLTPPSKPVTYLDRINSFSGSCETQKSAVEESPVMTPSLPPRPSLYRSFSDVNPCVTPASTLNSDEMTNLTASGQSGSGGHVISDGDNPSSRRWKRMRKSLMEMNKWLNDIIQEQNKGEDDDGAAAAADDDDDDDDDGEEKKIDNDQVQMQMQETHETLAEENVTAERDGDAVKVRYICSCGKHYQIAMSI